MADALGITDPDGFGIAARAFESSIEQLATHSKHPLVSVAHALLWCNVLNDAFHRSGKAAYVAKRDRDVDGRVIPGLVLAFNALKHGAAVCTALRPDYSGQGWSAGPWIMTSDVDELVRTLSRTPSAAQRTSYLDEVAGRRIKEPFGQALEWFERAVNHWSI